MGTIDFPSFPVSVTRTSDGRLAKQWALYGQTPTKCGNDHNDGRGNDACETNVCSDLIVNGTLTCTWKPDTRCSCVPDGVGSYTEQCNVGLPL